MEIQKKLVDLASKCCEANLTLQKLQAEYQVLYEQWSAENGVSKKEEKK